MPRDDRGTRRGPTTGRAGGNRAAPCPASPAPGEGRDGALGRQWGDMHLRGERGR